MKGECMKKILQNSKGMTLIELIVVMAIMALLASVVTTQVMGRLAQAKTDSTKTQIKNIEQALELYKADNDQYPTTDQGLRALIEVPTTGSIPENYPPGGYLKKMPKDAWNKEFVYICEDGQKYTIISYGADKKEGGTAKGKDISSDEL